MGERDAVTDAFWLPALEPADHDGFEERAFGAFRARVPRLKPDGVRRLAEELGRAREASLAQRPIAEIVDAVARAAAALADPDGPLRARCVELLPAITGYSREMIRHGLDRMAEDWRADALRSALAAELGDPLVLDCPRPHPRGAPGLVRAFGPRLVAHVFSGNVPGVSVTSLVRATLTKAASFGKTASGEPLTAVAFAHALDSVDPALARCIAVTHWPGGSEPLERALFESADAVIAYGSDASVDAVRRVAPAGTPLIAHPHRIGVALVAREALARAGPALAEAAARDVSVFDQQGCVAPHAIYVEADAAAAAVFAERLAAAMQTIADEWPRRDVSAAEAARIHETRAAMEFRGARVWSSPRGTAWTVILDTDPALTPSPLNRVVFVKPVADLAAALDALAPRRAWLQSVGLAADAPRFEALAERLGGLGASRVVALGRMSWPEPHGHPDGRFQFQDLLRFVDVLP